MRRRTIVLAVGITALVVGGVGSTVGPGLYADHVNGQAEAAPSIDAARPASLSVTDLQGSWTVSTGSFAGYRVEEVLRGHRATVTGRTDRVTGDVTVSGDQLTAVRITVDVGSITTPESARDAYVRGSLLDTGRFPRATYTLTAPVPLAAVAGGHPAQVPVTGDLAIHGVTRHVTATVQAAATAGGAQVAGSIPITFADYGVTAPSLGFVTVEDSGAVEFSLHLVRR